MKAWHLKIAGYFTVPLVPLAAAGLVTLEIEWIVPVLFFGVLPFSRRLTGSDRIDPEDAPLHSVAFCNLLALAPALWLPALAYLLLTVLGEIPDASGARIAALGATWFICAMLGTCAMHELTHRRVLPALIAGRILCGLVAYPHFPEIHRMHHSRVGAVRSEPVPHRGASVYGHATRIAIHEFMCLGKVGWSGARGLGAGWIGLATIVALTSAALSVQRAGTLGLVFYIGTAALIWFGVQSINYIQHYGLSSRIEPSVPHAWDHDCPLQAVLTCNISFHDQHHAQVNRPYFLFDARRNRTCLPTSYALLFLAALVPPLYRRIMNPALDRLGTDPAMLANTGGKPRFCLPGESL